MNRVVVTGMGALTSYGLGTKILWSKLLDGETIIKNIPASWKLSAEQEGIYSPLPTLNYKELGFSKMELMQYEPVTLNMLLAINEALESAKIEYTLVNDKLNRYHINNMDLNRFGIYVGTGVGGVDSLTVGTLDLNSIKNNESRRLDPFAIAKSMPNNIAASAGIKLRLHKNINSYAYACATGTITIGKAYESIKNGMLDIAIAGGSEYLDKAGVTYNGFLKAKTILTDGDPLTANCPFDKKRSGFLFSDGASGALVLESLEHATKRNANILAEVVGFEESFDGFNMVSGDPSGIYIQEMLETLLNEANIDAKDIGYINAHGTGTIKNDEIEAEIFEKLFGSNVAINSTKSLLGHTIAASGSIEAIVTLLSIRDQRVHKNNGLKDPIKDLNFVQKDSFLDIEYAISNSYAFGGHNGALLFRKYPSSGNS